MRPLLLALFLAAAPVAALATPTDDVVNAFTKMGAATSYHMAVESSEGAVDIDMAPPDKMHMLMPGKTEMIRIGSTTYVKANGNWMKMSMTIPGMDGQSGAVGYVRAFGTNPKDAKVEDLGSKSVDGATYHAYKVTPQNGKPATLYIDGSGYPARIDVVETKGPSIVRFSKYNAPVTIAAPI